MRWWAPRWRTPSVGTWYKASWRRSMGASSASLVQQALQTSKQSVVLQYRRTYRPFTGSGLTHRPFTGGRLTHKTFSRGPSIEPWGTTSLAGRCGTQVGTQTFLRGYLTSSVMVTNAVLKTTVVLLVFCLAECAAGKFGVIQFFCEIYKLVVPNFFLGIHHLNIFKITV